jgi:hypothetical protein
MPINNAVAEDGKHFVGMRAPIFNGHQYIMVIDTAKLLDCNVLKRLIDETVEGLVTLCF